MQPCRSGAFEEVAVDPSNGLVRGRPKEARGRSMFAISVLLSNFSFFAASAGCRGMLVREGSTHFPSADAWSPVRVTCDDLKKQESLHTPLR